MCGNSEPFVANSLSNTEAQKSNGRPVLHHMKRSLVLSLLAACGSFVLSAGGYAQEPRCTEQGSVRSVTKARSGSFETVTFEIVGGLPQSIEVTNAKPPIENYAGDDLHMEGPYFKNVSLHMVAWNCRIRDHFAAPTTTITGFRNTERFEGYVIYVIGYASRKKYVGFTKLPGKKISKVVVKFRR